MPTARRFIASILPLLAALAAAAQTAPAEPETIKVTLEEAIQRALAKSFSIKVEGYDAAIAQAGVVEALGKFDPVLNGTYKFSSSKNPSLIDTGTGLRGPAGSTKIDDYELGVGGVLPWGMTYQVGASSNNTRGTFNGFTGNFTTFAGVSATQPLLRNFGFGPTLTSIRIAQTDRDISEWAFRQAVIDAVTNVIYAYNDLNFAYANLRSAVRSRDLAAQLLDENQKRFKVGNVSEFDVTSARSRVASREEGVLIADRQMRDAENFLKQLITDEKSPGLLQQHVAIDPLPPAPVVVVDAAADFRIALENRPDYQQARLGLKRAEINRKYQFNQFLPRVDLVGSYGYSGYDTVASVARQQVRNKDYNDFSYGVTVSLPLGFTTERGRYRAAKLQQLQSETNISRVEQNIVVLVGNAAGQIETAQKRVEATRIARELAQTTLDAEVKRFRAGQGSTFFVSQQQELLAIAEIRAALAQTDYQKALAGYDRELGITLEKLHISVAPPPKR
ncbi:MAG TPA: TolC family protein [Lacunisphaera sp.]|nr:TolC family protein [Lacunisphaera sp.]